MGPRSATRWRGITPRVRQRAENAAHKQVERGLAIFDLGNVFRDEKGTIYADHIHYLQDAAGESRGNRLVAAAMAQKIAEA